MNDLIYDQNKIPKGMWRYGLRSSAAAGCGWIATHNALRLMGYVPKPEKLIRAYARGFPLVNGVFGTFLLSPVLFFRNRGFRVKVTARREKFDRVLKGCDVGILFFRWRRKFKVSSHYSAVQYRDGHVFGYNTFRDSVGPEDYGDSLEDFVRRQKFIVPVLIGICDKKEHKRMVQKKNMEKRRVET